MKVKRVQILNDYQLTPPRGYEYFTKNGYACPNSDLAKLMDNPTSREGNGSYYIGGATYNKAKREGLKHVGTDGKISSFFTRTSAVGVRIAISFDDIEDFDINKLNELNVEYPLLAISGVVGKTIERLFDDKSKLIIKTGGEYIIFDWL